MVANNWHQGNWNSVSSIIDHWGDFGKVLQATAGPTGKYGGHWHDMDMLLIGEHELGGLPGISDQQGKTQFGMWSLLAAPLIMGNDLRNVSDAAKAVLLNTEVIAIDQDKLGKMGLRVSPKGETEVWARELANGDIAVGLLNKGIGGSGGVDNCKWQLISSNGTGTGGYNESCGGNSGDNGCADVVNLEDAKSRCCGMEAECVSVSMPKTGHGKACFKKNDDCGWNVDHAYSSLVKLSQGPPQPPAKGTLITATFKAVGWGHATAKVRDLWEQKDLGTMSGSHSAYVPLHGLALLRLSPV